MTKTNSYATICLNYDKATKRGALSVCGLDNPAGDPRVFLFYIDEYAKAIEYICGLKYDYIFVYDHYALFSLIDRYIVEKHLKRWEQLKQDDGKARKVTQDCYALNDGEGAQYTRKLWLKVSDSRAQATSRHKRCHAVEFINFSLMTGRRPFLNVLEGYGISTEFDSGHPALEGAYKLNQLVKVYNSVYQRIMHEPYLNARGVAAWTVGSAAKNLYLSFKFPTIEKRERAKEYTRRYKNDENLEDKFRATGLLNAAALYCPRKEYFCPESDLFKYDVNSLFPATYRDLPQLGVPIKCKLEDYAAKDINLTYNSRYYEHIYTFNYLCLEVKKGMPCIFHNPFEVYRGGDTSYIEITQKFSIFKNLLDVILKYYDLVECEIADIYRCAKFPDPATRKYVDFLYPLKLKAKEENNPALYTLIKLFLNNLHGKFAQKSYRRDFELIKDNDGVVCKKFGDFSVQWKEKHFDFVRGAYIYSSAQAAFLTKILEAAKAKNYTNLKEHIFYCDTDSVLTDLPLFEHSEDLGAFKLEGQFKHGFTIAPKIYGLSNFYDSGVLVCAGAQGDYIAQQLIARGAPFWIWCALLKNEKFMVRIRKRTKDIIIETEVERPIYEANYNYDEI